MTKGLSTGRAVSSRVTASMHPSASSGINWASGHQNALKYLARHWITRMLCHFKEIFGLFCGNVCLFWGKFWPLSVTRQCIDWPERKFGNASWIDAPKNCLIDTALGNTKQVTPRTRSFHMHIWCLQKFQIFLLSPPCQSQISCFCFSSIFSWSPSPLKCGHHTPLGIHLDSTVRRNLLQELRNVRKSPRRGLKLVTHSSNWQYVKEISPNGTI